MQFKTTTFYYVWIHKIHQMEGENNIQKYRPLENLHIVFWLVKDTCWCTFSRPLGLAMIFPTIALAIYISFVHRHERVELMHNLAVVCWICANSIWMVGEFYFNDGLRPFAIGFFVTGLAIIAFYYLSRFIFKKKV